MEWLSQITNLADMKFIVLLFLAYLLLSQNMSKILSYLDSRKKAKLEGVDHICTKGQDLVDIQRQIKAIDADVDEVRESLLHESTVNETRHAEYLARFNRIDKRMDDLMDFLLTMKMKGQV